MPTRRLKPRLEIPRWMQRWPRGLRPHGIRGTAERVELLYFAPSEQWVRVGLRHDGQTGAAKAWPVASRHDDTRAQRRLAHAVTAHFRRDGAVSRRWLDESIAAAARLESRQVSMEGREDFGGDAALRLLDVIHCLAAGGELQEVEDLPVLVDAVAMSLAPREVAADVAVVGVFVALGHGDHGHALAQWGRHREALEVRDDAAALLCSAVMQAFLGDRVSAQKNAERLTHGIRDFVDARATGELFQLLGLPAEACRQFAVAASDVGGLQDHRRTLHCANLAGLKEPAKKASNAMLAVARTADERLAAAEGRVQAGAFDEAETMLRHLVARQPDHLATAVRLATLLLWSGQTTEAEARARQLLETGHDTCETRRIVGVAELLGGNASAGIAMLEAALAHHPADPESLLWLAEAKAGVGDFRGAREATKAWVYGDHPVWQLTRVLVEEKDAPGRAIARDTWFIGDALLAQLLGDEWDPTVFSPRSEVVLDAITRVFATLGGNRGLRLTQVDSTGSMRWIDEVQSPRRRSEKLMDRLATSTPDELLGEFADSSQRWPRVPFTVTYAAELRMWRGEYEMAHALFDEAWRTTKTRWGYVGTGACLVLLGRYDEALEAWRAGLEHYTYLDAEATFAYRGELHRLRGDFDKAIEDLEFALVHRPTRVGALANLALTHVQRGDDQAAAAAAVRLAELAPTMVWLARVEAGLEPRTAIEAHEVEVVIERLLTMMRGNRSSVIPTLVDATGQLRVFPSADLEGWGRYARRCSSFAEDHLLQLICSPE